VKLWVSNGGVISCTKHGGGYLQASVEARPNARRHTTPLDVWDLIPADEIPLVAKELGVEPELLCERHDSHIPCS
jgi:hypothetical protein